MIAVRGFAGKKVAVFGLGSSGLVAAHALAAGGAQIICYDDKRARVDAALNAGLPTGDLRVADFTAFDALVLSPGVPLTHPAPHFTVTRAQEAGIEIIGDIELFDRERRARLPDLKLVAITGTNGKSTTTALLTHLLRQMGVAVQMGGNIGRPALDLDPSAGVAVLEVSSFQIDLSPTLAPDVGVLLNVTSDHLDRHGTIENYAALKWRLVEGAAHAVVCENASTRARLQCFARDSGVPLKVCAEGTKTEPGFDDDHASGIIAQPVKASQQFAGEPQTRRVTAGHELHEIANGVTRPLGTMPQVPALRGAHNLENAVAALGVVSALGLDAADAVRHLATFPGLPHRIEEVGRAGAVVFVNDSKATNLESACTALKAFDNIHWIAGGRAKPGGLDSLSADKYAIARAYLIGEAADEFNAQLTAKEVATRMCGTLDAALDAAAAEAEAAGGGVVLLSPACASFDQFGSFEERGNTFRNLVRTRLEAANG